MNSENREELNPAEPKQTPLEQAQRTKKMQRQNLEVTQQRPDDSPEIPGAGKPSDKRKHPQRQLYGGKDS